MNDLLTNVPEFSVSEISLSLKKTVEEAFSRVRVRGELSRVTIAKSGHMYSNLKDENAVIDAVCWKGTVNKLPIQPEEGMEVICTGRLTTFAGKSSYQLIIEDMELAGEGALLKLLEKRKQKLSDEGLFDVNVKKPPPFLPHRIGVVTSPTGAVIRDIIHRIRDRFPCHILVWPVQVQGKNSENGIARAINGFNKTSPSNRPDIIIVARGGGSLEDLMPFNEEVVVRSVYASKIPVISAVGHETDITLCDFVADVRAPTPTGAAEMAVPVRSNLTTQINEDDNRMRKSMHRFLNDLRRNIETTSRILENPTRMIDSTQQRFDAINDRIDHVFESQILKLDRRLITLSGRLRTPSAILDTSSIQLQNLKNRLDNEKHTSLSRHSDYLINTSRMLETLSYKSILSRGYAVLKDTNGNILKTVEAVKKAGEVNTHLIDGSTTLVQK
jgi:exodeoxyribonuclease VII large subunit